MITVIIQDDFRLISSPHHYIQGGISGATIQNVLGEHLPN